MTYVLGFTASTPEYKVASISVAFGEESTIAQSPTGEESTTTQSAADNLQQHTKAKDVRPEDLLQGDEECRQLERLEKERDQGSFAPDEGDEDDEASDADTSVSSHCSTRSSYREALRRRGQTEDLQKAPEKSKKYTR